MFAPRYFAAAGLTALLTSTAAQALTADQVWQGWQTNAAAIGLTLTADPATTAAGALTLRNIGVSADGENLFGLAQLTLTETPEGAVRLTLPAEFALKPAPPEDVRVDVTVAQTGLSVTITEPTPGARIYDYGADALTVSGNVLSLVDMFDGGPKQEDKSVFNVAFTGMAGTYSDTPGTNRSFAATFAAKSFVLNLDQSSPYAGQSTQTSSAQDFALQGTFIMPATFDLTSMENPGQMADALRDGLAATVAFTQGSGASEQSMTSEFFSFSAKTASPGSSMQAAFSKAGFLIAADSEPVTATITSPELPFPQLDLAFGPAQIEFKFPVIGPEVQDFRFRMKFDSIAVNDEAWAVFDPTAVLARTPIVLDVDVTGRSSLDVFGLMQSDADGSVPPIPQVERADIVRLLVSAAGAEVAGNGAFTFDNSAGYPLPMGNADFVVKGANRMVDALITLGVVTADDAMGARMAMALILEPTAEPDVMTSKVEARADGGLYVNGQRMR